MSEDALCVHPRYGIRNVCLVKYFEYHEAYRDYTYTPGRRLLFKDGRTKGYYNNKAHQENEE